MCRGKKICFELSEDPKKWDLFCPLRPPIWMENQIDVFVAAVDAFVKGDKVLCLSTLNTLRNDEIQTWYIEHGQMSGKFRKDILGITPPSPIDEDLRDPLRAPKKYQDEVFTRDGYRCRYCGGRLINQKFIKTFIKKLDSILFIRGETNLDTHGIIHMTWPVADHVIPWNI